MTAATSLGTRLAPIPQYLARSPWGDVEGATEHAPGVYFVETPSHGGFLVTVEAWRTMPRGLRLVGVPCALGTMYAFEEDCAYAAVVASFPDVFAPASVETSRGIVRSWYPEHADGGEGCGTSQVGASFHRCRR